MTTAKLTDIRGKNQIGQAVSGAMVRGIPFPASASRTLKPWSVDRWGRFLAGTFALIFVLLAHFHHSFWLLGLLGLSANLVISSLTDSCALHDLLIRLGAREREDLFLPGGEIRDEQPQQKQSRQKLAA